jgi:hypothetical protein
VVTGASCPPRVKWRVIPSPVVYGTNPELPTREAMRPMPISPYAASKLADDGHAAAFTQMAAWRRSASLSQRLRPAAGPDVRYAPVVGFKEGLERLVGWYRSLKV